MARDAKENALIKQVRKVFSCGARLRNAAAYTRFAPKPAGTARRDASRRRKLSQAFGLLIECACAHSRDKGTAERKPTVKVCTSLLRRCAHSAAQKLCTSTVQECVPADCKGTRTALCKPRARHYGGEAFPPPRRNASATQNRRVE